MRKWCIYKRGKGTLAQLNIIIIMRDFLKFTLTFYKITSFFVGFFLLISFPVLIDTFLGGRGNSFSMWYLSWFVTIPAAFYMLRLFNVYLVRIL